MKQVIFAVAMILIISMTIGGNCVAEGLVAVDYLAEYAELSGEEINPDMLGEIVKRFSLTVNELENIPKDELRAGILEIAESNFMNNYNYLINTSTPDSQDDLMEFASIKRIAVYCEIETLTETSFVDLTTGMVYADRTRMFLDDISKAEFSRALSDDEISKLESLIAEGNWSVWSSSYAGDTNYIGQSEFMIAFETDKGVSQYVVSGSNSDAPDKLFDIVHEIIVLSIGDAYYAD